MNVVGYYWVLVFKDTDFILMTDGHKNRFYCFEGQSNDLFKLEIT